MKSSQEINDIKLWSTVILAAGKGTRMNSDTPKVVLDLNGKPIIIWGLELITQLGFTDITVVTGHKADLVESVIKKDFQNISFCRVEELLGTAHSLQQALPHISPNSKNILVLFGDDLALYSPSSICEFVNYHQNNDNKVTFLTLLKKRPTELGGLEKDEDGNVIGVLTKSMQEERKLKSHEIVCGAFCFDIEWLKQIIGKIEKNPISGEYPLPAGVIKMAAKTGEKVKTFRLKHSNEWNSINSPQELKLARKKKEILIHGR